MNKKISIKHPIKIQFYDVDLMKVVWHGNYIKYFEEARTVLMDSIGYGYDQMEKDGYIWPIVDLQIKYIKPLILGQNITVEAVLADYINRLKVDFKITTSEGVLLTKGYTIQVAVKIGNNMLEIETPNCFQERIINYEKNIH